MPPIPTETVITIDLQEHIEDDLEVSAIRDGQLVTLSWNDLTEAEKRAAYANTFDPCGLNTL